MSIFHKGKPIATAGTAPFAISDIVQQTNAGIKDLEDKRVASIENVETTKINSLNEIEERKENCISEIENTRDSVVADVTAEGTVQVNLCKDQVNLAKDEVVLATAQAELATQKAEEAVGVAIGTYLDIASNQTYTPPGYLLRDGAEYSKSQFESFYDNWLTTPLYTLCGYMEMYSSTIYKGFDAELIFKIGDNAISEEGLIDYDGYHLVYIFAGKIKAYTSEAGEVEFGDAVANTEFTAKLVCSDTITITINDVTLTQSIKSGKITLMNNSVKQCSLLSSSLIDGNALYANGKYNSSIGYVGSSVITEIGTTHIGANLKVCSHAEYNKQIENNGFCDKFAVDTENQKFRAPLANPNNRVLIEKKEPTAENPYWYNLYNDGWCEQGGVTIPSASTANKEVVLGVEYRDTNYQVLIGNEYTASATAVACVVTSTKTTAGFTIADSKTATYYTYWRTQGYTNQVVADSTRPYVVVASGELNQSDMDWSQWATSLEGKVDKGDMIPCATIIEWYENGTEGYVVYSNNYCEQWGKAGRTAASQAITLFKPYRDVNYGIVLQAYHTALNTDGRPPLVYNAETAPDGFTINLYTGYAGAYWRTYGFIQG